MNREKITKIIYWIATLWLSLSMLSSGIFQLFRIKGGHEFIINNLGYPSYFLTILGIWKILGVVAILVPKYPLVKEWAYAGFMFVATGIIFSHVAGHSPVSEVVPGILLVVLVALSWWLRPASRKVVA